MVHDVLRIDRLVFVRLKEAPTKEGVDELRAAILAARREAGRPLIYLGLIPSGAVAMNPSAEMRGIMAAFARQVSSVCEAVHLVVEVEGFQGTIVRSAVTAVAMITRERNLTVHRRLADAVTAVQPQLGDPKTLDLERLLKAYGSAA